MLGAWTRIDLGVEVVGYIEAVHGENILFWRGPSGGTLRRATYSVSGSTVTLGPITDVVGLSGRGDKPSILNNGGGNLELYYTKTGYHTQLTYATSSDYGVTWVGETTVTVGPFPTPSASHPPNDSGQLGGGGIIEVNGERRLYAQNNFGEIIVTKGTAGSSGPLTPVATLIAPTPNGGVAGSAPFFFENQSPSGDAIQLPGGQVLYMYVDGEGGETTRGAVGFLVLDEAGTGFIAQKDNFVTVSDAGLVTAGMTRLDEATINNVSFSGGTMNAFLFLSSSLQDIFYAPLTAELGSSFAAFNVEINGPTPGTQYDQVEVTGTIDLGGALLTLVPTTTADGDEYVIVKNDGTDPVVGTFSGLPEGATVTPNPFGSSGLPAFITYKGGDGNDVVILVSDASPVVDLSAHNPGAADSFILSRKGDSIVITDGDGIVVFSKPKGSISGTLVITGEDGFDDKLTIDFSGGDPLETINVTFNGGTGGHDSLETLQGSFPQIHTARHTASVTSTATSKDGTLEYFYAATDFTNDTPNSTITYTGLEPVADNLSTINRIFTFNGGAETITLTDAGQLTEIVSSDLTISKSGGGFAIGTTTFQDLVGINGAAFINGDVIAITGTDPVTGVIAQVNFTVTDITTTTLGDLITAISGAYGNATASIVSGEIRLTADTAGVVVNTITLDLASDAGGNANPDPLGVFSTLRTGGPGLTIASTLGESVTFPVPTTSLTINGGTGADIINVTSISSGFVGSLTIDGGDDTDTVNIGANLTLGSGAVTGNVSITGETITLGNVTIKTDGGTAAGVISLTGAVVIADGASVTLDSNGGGTDGTITLSSTLAGNAGVGSENISFDSGSVTTLVTGAVGPDINTLTVTDSGGTTFSSTVSATTVALTNTTGTIQFSGGLTATTLTAAANAYTVSLLGSTNTVTNLVTFNNTGGLTLGNGGDVFNFNGGLVSTASTTTINGTVNTTDDDVTLGVVTLSGTADIDTTGGAAGDILISSTIATGGNALNLDAGAAGNVTLSGAVTGGGAMTVRDGAVQSYQALTVGSLNIQDATTSVTFNGAIAATTTIDVDSGGSITQSAQITSGTNVDYDAGTTIGITAAIGVSGTVDIDSTGVTTIGATGDITAGGAVTFGASKTGTLTTSGDIDTTDDNVTFTRAVTLGGAVDIDTTGGALGNILFSSTIATGGNALNLDAGAAGNVTLSGAMTGGGALTVRDGATQNYSVLTVTSVDIQSSSTAVTFGGAVTVTANNASGGNALKTNAAGTVTVNAIITATAAVNLDIDIDPTDVAVNASMTATGNIDITASNNVTVAAAVVVRADSDGDGGTLNITADDANDVDGAGDLTASTTSTLRGHTVNLDGFNVTTGIVTADVGDATITANNEITLNGVTTATTAQVVVTATADDVNINANITAGTNVDIAATAGNVIQGAGNNVLAGGSVEIDAGTNVDQNGTIGATTAIGTDVRINTNLLGSVAIDGNITANGAVSIGQLTSGAVTIGAAGTARVITSDSDGGGTEDITVLSLGAITQSTAGSSLNSNTGAIIVRSAGSTVTLIGADSNGANQATSIATDNPGTAAITVRASGLATVTGLDTAGASGAVEVVSDTAGISVGTITAGVSGGNVFLEATTVATGEITDNNVGTINVTASGLALRAAIGIGSGDALETDLLTLAAINTTSGNIRIDDIGGNANLLTIGTVGTLIGITNSDADDTAFGFVNVSNASPLTVAATITSEGDIVLTALESATVNSDVLTISAAVTADNVANTAKVILNAGDDVVVTTATGTVTSDTSITINVEESVDADGNATADGSNLDPGSGGQVTVDGSKILLTAPGGTVIRGGADATAPGDSDIFNITPQEFSAITVFGLNPVLPTTPGDTLNMNFAIPPLIAADLPPTLTIGVPGAGVYSFPVASGLETVTYFSIEDVNAAGAYHLVLNGALAGSYGDDAIDVNDTADEIRVSLSGTDLVLERTGPIDPDFSPAVPPVPNNWVGEIFRGNIANILSLTIEGTDDGETVTINDAGGIPDFAGTVPLTPDNPHIAGTPEMLFNGRDGNDALIFSVDTNAVNQIYALGNGVGGGFGSDSGAAQGEIRTDDGAAAELILYFTGLEPITTLGALGGTLTIIGDLEPQLIEVIDASDASVVGPTVGFTRVQAWNSDRDGGVPTCLQALRVF